jgi:hypothetical protein
MPRLVRTLRRYDHRALRCNFKRKGTFSKAVSKFLSDLALAAAVQKAPAKRKMLSSSREPVEQLFQTT